MAEVVVEVVTDPSSQPFTVEVVEPPAGPCASPCSFTLPAGDHTLRIRPEKAPFEAGLHPVPEEVRLHFAEGVQSVYRHEPTREHYPRRLVAGNYMVAWSFQTMPTLIIPGILLAILGGGRDKVRRAGYGLLGVAGGFGITMGIGFLLVLRNPATVHHGRKVFFIASPVQPEADPQP
jgi:hypothetical protein